jgi:hypothetical protein
MAVGVENAAVAALAYAGGLEQLYMQDWSDTLMPAPFFPSLTTAFLLRVASAPPEALEALQMAEVIMAARWEAHTAYLEGELREPSGLEDLNSVVAHFVVIQLPVSLHPHFSFFLKDGPGRTTIGVRHQQKWLSLAYKNSISRTVCSSAFIKLVSGCMGRGKLPLRSFGPKGPPMYWCHAQNRSGEKFVPDINKSGSLWLIRLPCLGLYVPGPLYTSCLGAWAVGSSQHQKDRQCTGVTLKIALVKNWCPTSTKVVLSGLLDYHVSDCMSQGLYIPRVWVPGPWEAARAVLWTNRTANVLVYRSKSLW